jgi:hypothetical protein
VFNFTSGRNLLNFRYTYYVRECVKIFREFYLRTLLNKGKGREELGNEKRRVGGEGRGILFSGTHYTAGTIRNKIKEFENEELNNHEEGTERVRKLVNTG